MKILFLDGPFIFKCVPRVDITFDALLVLNLRNEITNHEFSQEVNFTNVDLLEIELSFAPADFKIQNKYEITLMNGNDIIYRGKLLILKSGTDIQNYEYKTQNDEYFRFK